MVLYISKAAWERSWDQTAVAEEEGGEEKDNSEQQLRESADLLFDQQLKQ